MPFVRARFDSCGIRVAFVQFRHPFGLPVGLENCALGVTHQVTLSFVGESTSQVHTLVSVAPRLL